MADIVFAPGVGTASFELGEFRRDPDNPDRIIGEIVATFKFPNPLHCAVLKNVDWSTDGREQQ
jgi:hypothetical protein